MFKTHTGEFLKNLSGQKIYHRATLMTRHVRDYPLRLRLSRSICTCCLTVTLTFKLSELESLLTVHYRPFTTLFLTNVLLSIQGEL